MFVCYIFDLNRNMSEKIYCSRIRYTPSKCVQLVCNLKFPIFFSAIIDGSGRGGEGVVWKVAALPKPYYIIQ